ncbi:glucosaminidase domain-containing protein [Dongshaea marina]|uniref:glucosaminidase domain-containing protein n=1 Tax=Dongshaea marina TaxID=2047966 RepID=UPI000D3E93A4|nr:glucosaminidase domain-containing protein [Dongshaea marina]
MKAKAITMILITGLSVPSYANMTKLSNNVSPPEFLNIKNTKEKKDTFFNYFYNISKHENMKILSERETLLNYPKMLNSISRICHKYSKFKCNPEQLNRKTIDSLLSRVDIIPYSLILAQAANESAWGSSRFARKANNYFGQWCFSKGCGIVPLNRSIGMHHEVKKFNSPQESVAAYIFNLNTNSAYSKLREIRNQSHLTGKPITGTSLANGLQKYSTRGNDYIREIKQMIKYNHLAERFDSIG